MTRPLEEALTNLLPHARRFNEAAVDALVNLNRRLEEARTMPTAPVTLRATVDPMSADAPPRRLRVGSPTDVDLLTSYVGPVLNAYGLAARLWDLHIDRRLEPGTLLLNPAALTVTAHEEADVDAALLYAEHRRQARRYLRTVVVRVALEAGLTDVRPFARPIGA